MSPLVVFTIGHSTRPIEEFLRLLRAHRIECLIDVRTIPRSKHNPQYGGEALAGALRDAGIDYRHLPGLGGLRRPRADSVNLGLTNLSFRGYADYMQTPAFEVELKKCLTLAERQRVALMCAEGMPWRCHRSLIADALVVRGVEAREITSGIRARLHALSSAAHVDGKTLTYPEREPERRV